MNHKLYLKNLQDIYTQQYNPSTICAKFYVGDMCEFMDYATDTFEKNLSSFMNEDDFDTIYHKFLYHVVDICDDTEVLLYISNSINKHVQSVKDRLKPYNKKEKSKDDLYSDYQKFKSDLLSNQVYADDKIFNTYEKDKIKFMEYLIFELKDIDALYHIVSTHKEIVNIWANDGTPLIEIVVRHVISNIDTLSRQDIDYFKSVIMLIIIRNEFTIDKNTINELIEDLNFEYGRTSKDKKHDIEFIRKQLGKFVNVDYIDETCANDIIIPKLSIEDRYDLRKLNTITIDYIKYANNTNMLYDDAFSYEELKDGTSYLYLHVPDVDQFIPRDSKLDEYMRRNVESLYLKGYKKPMMPYSVSSELSLKEGFDKLALTFRLHVTEDGTILGIDSFKSIIHVDNNYSKNACDIITTNSLTSNHELINKMHKICVTLRKLRHEKTSKRSKAGIVMDEYNIWTNIALASYFNENNIVFPYINHSSNDSTKYTTAIDTFLRNTKVDEETQGIVYTLGDTKQRSHLSTICEGNNLFNKLPYGNVTNPLREYLSLETDRLIRDIMIDELHNYDYWADRISDDVSELNETMAKVKELYKTI